MAWGDDRRELIVPYDPAQRDLYEADDRKLNRKSIFYPQRWPTELRSSRQRSGRFPEIAVRASFRALGFSVLISELRMPGRQGFILANYAGMRERHHPAYTRMFGHFPADQLEEFNRKYTVLQTTDQRYTPSGRTDIRFMWRFHVVLRSAGIPRTLR